MLLAARSISLLSHAGCSSFMWHKSGTGTFLLQLGTPAIITVPQNDWSGLVQPLAILNPCVCGRTMPTALATSKRSRPAEFHHGFRHLRWRGVAPHECSDNSCRLSEMHHVGIALNCFRGTAACPWTGNILVRLGCDVASSEQLIRNQVGRWFDSTQQHQSLHGTAR